MISKINFKIDLLIFLLISSLIFITRGEYPSDYFRILLLKLFLILIVCFKIKLIDEIKYNIIEYKNTSIVLTLYIISITISYILAPFKINDFAYNWLRIRYLHTITDIFLFIFLYLYFYKKDINYKYLSASILIPGIIFSIFLLINAVINDKIQNTNEQIIFFDGYRSVGMLLTFLISFYFGKINNKIINKNSIKNIFVISLFLTLAIYFSGRASLISIFFTFLIIIIINFTTNRNNNHNFFIFIFSLPISYIISHLISKHEIITRIINRRNFQEHYGVDFENPRIAMWDYAINLILENPFFGKGPGSYFISSFNDMIAGKLSKFLVHAQPHNVIIQFLLEWGMIGTILILILFLKLFFLTIKILIKKKIFVIIPYGLGLLSLSIHSFVDGTFFHPTFTFYIIICISILCSEIHKINHRL